MFESSTGGDEGVSLEADYYIYFTKYLQLNVVMFLVVT